MGTTTRKPQGKKSAKIKDLPARSLGARKAASVKGGILTVRKAGEKPLEYLN